MVKSMLPKARVEKEQCLNQCCLQQGWEKTNVLINVAYGNGENKPMINQCCLRQRWKQNNGSINGA